MSQVTENVSFAPAIVRGEGATSTARKLDVVSKATAQAKLALCDVAGKVGKAARAGLADSGLVAIAEQAYAGNYRPLAEVLAVRLARPIVISNRARFESLPDNFEEEILKIRDSKSGGYRVGRDGVEVPTSAMKQALEAKAFVVEVIRMTRALHEARQADRAKLGAPADAE